MDDAHPWRLPELGSGDGEQLIERERELRGIRDACEAALGGGGSALFAVGTAGIGKSSLLRAGVRAAIDAGFSVSLAAGSPMESGLPFGLLDRALLALGGGREIAEPLSMNAGTRLRARWRELVRAAAARPLLLALDDLHWADDESLELLGFVCRRLAGTRLAVLGCLRPAPDGAAVLVRELAVSANAGVMRLGPLSRRGATALVARGAGRAADDELGGRLWAACAGTPLLLQAAAAAGSDGAAADGQPVNTFARALLIERFTGGDAVDLQYLEAAAVLGTQLFSSVVAPLAELTEDAGEAAHVRLVRAGLLEDLGGGWSRFVHPFLAQAIHDSQPASVRERRQARAFQLLQERGAPDAVAAAHARAAALHGDRRAHEVSLRVGRAALTAGEVGAACSPLSAAVEIAGDSAGAELLLDCAEAQIGCARLQEGERLCERALAGEAPRVATHARPRARALALRARIAALRDDVVDAAALHDEAVATGEAATTAAASVVALASARCLWPPSRTRDAACQALAGLPDRHVLRAPLELLGLLARLRAGDQAAEVALAAEWGPWLATAADEVVGAGPRIGPIAIDALMLLEDYDAAATVCQRELARSLRVGAAADTLVVSIACSDLLCRLGRPAEALATAERATALTGGAPPAFASLGIAVALVELGRTGEAAAHVARARAVARRGRSVDHGVLALWLDVLDARAQLAAGDAVEASETMLQAASIADLTGWRHPAVVPWAGVAIDAHLAAARDDRARELVDWLEEVSRPLAARWPRAVTLLGRARLAAAAGHRDADELFSCAMALFRELPMPICRAEALLAFGRHLRRSGRPRAAREPLRLAVDLAEQAGAARVLTTARAEFRAAGARRRRRGHDPSALTSQERRVAEKAAAGMTNAAIGAALYLSPKTVEHHLCRTYSKLGIRSRHELVRAGVLGDDVRARSSGRPAERVKAL